VTEVRMEPASDEDQSCLSFRLTVSPPAELFRYQDGFGNHVHHFNLLPPHEQVHVLAAGVVETHPRPRDPFASPATHPLGPEALDLGVFDFLAFRGPVRRAPALGEVLEAVRPRPGTRLAQVVADAAHFIYGHFEYARDVTLASSPIDDVLEKGKGVCQDFAHLMIAVLRAFGVPARYVSGYIHRPNKESQSHAWCEAWLPGLGWFGIDPTNDRAADDHFIKVAVGRDFTDVPPNKGVWVCRAPTEETISVRVETRELDRLPSLSWQEQLPPLNMPLTAIARQTRSDFAAEEDAQQQQ
jgi:transglutaminase-like putative cysteine protease